MRPNTCSSAFLPWLLNVSPWPAQVEAVAHHALATQYKDYPRAQISLLLFFFFFNKTPYANFPINESDDLCAQLALASLSLCPLSSSSGSHHRLRLTRLPALRFRGGLSRAEGLKL